MNREIKDQMEAAVIDYEESRSGKERLEEYALRKAQRAIEKGKHVNEEFHDRFKKHRDMFWGQYNRERVCDLTELGRSDVWPSNQQEAFYVLCSQLHQISFFGQEWYDVTPQDRNTTTEQVEIAKALIMNQLEDCEFRHKRQLMIEYYLKFGTLILYPYWRRQTGNLRKVVENQSRVEDDKTEIIETIISEHGDVSIIHPLNFFFSSVATTNDRAQDFVMVRSWISRNVIKANRQRRVFDGITRRYEPVAGFINTSELDNISSAVHDREDLPEEAIQTVEDEALIDDFGNVEVFDVHFAPGVFDPVGDGGIPIEDLVEWLDENNFDASVFGSAAWVISVAENQLLIRMELEQNVEQANPFIVARYLNDDNCAWGRGMMDITESGQLELKKKRDQANDAVDFRVHKPHWAKRGVMGQFSGSDRMQDILLPGKVVEIDDLEYDRSLGDVIKGVDIMGNPQEAFMAAGELSVDLQRATGAVDSLRGAYTSGRKTATETQSVSSGAMARMVYISSGFDTRVLDPLLSAFYKLTQQHITRTRAIYVVGSDGARWKRVEPMDIASEMAFNAKGAFMARFDPVVMQQMIQMGSIPYFENSFKWGRLARTFVEALGFPKPSEFVQDPDKFELPLTIDEQHDLLLLGKQPKLDLDQNPDLMFMEVEQHRAFFTQTIVESLKPLPDRVFEAVVEHFARHEFIANKLAQMVDAQRAEMLMNVAMSAKKTRGQMMASQGGQGDEPQSQNRGQTANQGRLQPQKTTGPQSPDAGGNGRGR